MEYSQASSLYWSPAWNILSHSLRRGRRFFYESAVAVGDRGWQEAALRSRPLEGVWRGFIDQV
eukprot:8573455-Pyramimonas_sp.AAC.1